LEGFDLNFEGFGRELCWKDLKKLKKNEERERKVYVGGRDDLIWGKEKVSLFILDNF